MSIAAFLLSFFVSFPIARFAEIIGAIDYPSPERKRHKEPMTRLGGLAIYLSFVLCVAISGAVADSAVILFVVGGAAIMLFGMCDDVFNYSATKKLFAEYLIAFLSAAFMCKVKGIFQISCLLFSSLFIIFMINAFNIIDGVDGLCASMSLVAFLFLSQESYFAYLLFFSVLGFLPRNLPAKMYLGECGAAFLGYAISVLILFSGVSVATVSLIAIPAVEVISSVIRRLLKKKSPFRADRSHIHHKLQDAGLSAYSVSVLLMGTALLFSLAVFSLLNSN